MTLTARADTTYQQPSPTASWRTPHEHLEPRRPQPAASGSERVRRPDLHPGYAPGVEHIRRSPSSGTHWIRARGACDRGGVVSPSISLIEQSETSTRRRQPRSNQTVRASSADHTIRYAFVSL